MPGPPRDPQESGPPMSASQATPPTFSSSSTRPAATRTPRTTRPASRSPPSARSLSARAAGRSSTSTRRTTAPASGATAAPSSSGDGARLELAAEHDGRAWVWRAPARARLRPKGEARSVPSLRLPAPPRRRPALRQRRPVCDLADAGRLRRRTGRKVLRGPVALGHGGQGAAMGARRLARSARSPTATARDRAELELDPEREPLHARIFGRLPWRAPRPPRWRAS